MATIVTTNAGLHVLGTLMTSAYSPGLVTSVLLYIPIGSLALIHGFRTISASQFRLGVITGLAIHGVVIVIAWV